MLPAQADTKALVALDVPATDVLAPSTDLDDFLAMKAEAIRKCARNAMIEIGQHLHEVQTELARRGGDHSGRFLQWLKREFSEWSQRSLYNCINIYKLSTTAQFANFANWDSCDPSGLYLLARPSTPEAAREEFIARAETGERLKHADVQAIIKRHGGPAGGTVEDRDNSQIIPAAETSDDEAKAIIAAHSPDAVRAAAAALLPSRAQTCPAVAATAPASAVCIRRQGRRFLSDPRVRRVRAATGRTVQRPASGIDFLNERRDIHNQRD
jgi:hypothetical protein